MSASFFTLWATRGGIEESFTPTKRVTISPAKNKGENAIIANATETTKTDTGYHGEKIVHKLNASHKNYDTN